jgi:hypothetical protein
MIYILMDKLPYPDLTRCRRIDILIGHFHPIKAQPWLRLNFDRSFPSWGEYHPVKPVWFSGESVLISS